MEPGAEILTSARGLIQRHGLRAVDTIHLASALGLPAAANEPVTFVAADQRLLRAAIDEQRVTVNPEAPRGDSDGDGTSVLDGAWHRQAPCVAETPRFRRRTA
jgi:hypothetical protein